jgi:prepilin-type N-terminal cleavage/methylation domain-containing protein
MQPARWHRTTPGGGFTLMETVVALAIIGWVLLWTMALLVEETRIGHRLDAHHEVLEVLDALHESIRAGRPVASGEAEVEWRLLFDPPADFETAEELRVWTRLESTGTPGLSKVTLVARYFVRQGVYERTVETLIWSG